MVIVENLKDIFSLNNKYAVYNFVVRNLKLKYRKSVLGVLWTMLIPAVTAVVYFFVFQFVMKLKIPNYLLFILSGVIPWSFFSGTIISGMESIVGNHPILNKVPLPPHTFPLIESVTAFLNLLFAVPVLIVVALFYDLSPTVIWLQLPVLLVLLLLQGYFIAILCSVLFVFLRDLRHIMNVVMQIWFYMTPVIYSSDMVPEKFAWIKYVNPVAFIFHGFHQILIFDSALSLKEFGVLAAWTLMIMAISSMVYGMNRKFLIERL